MASGQSFSEGNKDLTESYRNLFFFENTDYRQGDPHAGPLGPRRKHGLAWPFGARWLVTITVSKCKVWYGRERERMVHVL